MLVPFDMGIFNLIYQNIVSLALKWFVRPFRCQMRESSWVCEWAQSGELMKPWPNEADAGGKS